MKTLTHQTNESLKIIGDISLENLENLFKEKAGKSLVSIVSGASTPPENWTENLQDFSFSMPFNAEFFKNSNHKELLLILDEIKLAFEKFPFEILNSQYFLMPLSSVTPFPEYFASKDNFTLHIYGSVIFGTNEAFLVVRTPICFNVDLVNKFNT